MSSSIVAASGAEGGRHPRKAWSEVLPYSTYTADTAPAGSRCWVLQSLFGAERKSGSSGDLRFLQQAAVHANSEQMLQQGGFSVQSNGTLCLQWSDHILHGALEWQMAAAGQRTQWELTCTIVTGFVGSDLLAGYNELRRFTAHASIPVRTMVLLASS